MTPTSSLTSYRPTGQLNPWVDPVTGALGWQVITQSSRLAVTVAATVPGAITRPHGNNGKWRTRLPDSTLPVIVESVEAGTLGCLLSTEPSLGVLTLAFASWPTAMVVRCPLMALPTQGWLTIRDAWLTVIADVGRYPRL